MNAPTTDRRPRWWALLRRLPLSVVAAVVLVALAAGLGARSLWTVAPLEVDAAGAVATPAPVPAPVSRVDRLGWLGAAPVAAGAATVATTGGDVAITGMVVDGDGQPVPGAVVSLSRFVGRSEGSVTVVANEAGRFLLEGALGGRWRARAWAPPDLPLGPSVVRFIDAGTRVDWRVATGPQAPLQLTVEVLTDGEQARIGVGVAVTRVLLDASTVDEPLPDAVVQVTWPSGYDGPDAVVAADGTAVVEGVCDPDGRTPGPATVTVAVGEVSQTVTLTGCEPPRPPATTTTTTVPRRPTTTTTTVTPSTTTSTTTTTTTVPGPGGDGG